MHRGNRRSIQQIAGSGNPAAMAARDRLQRCRLPLEMARTGPADRAAELNVGRTLLSDAFEFDFDLIEFRQSTSKASDKSVRPTRTAATLSLRPAWPPTP